MVISHELLEDTCKKVIETILLCLEHATKGTVYRIGPPPELRAVRITSGIRNGQGEAIQWGLPQVSDYNFPGKTWEQYRDTPNKVLEAMGWCVERQKSWTADNPEDDIRSVRKQLLGEPEDPHHMEPVLVRKRDLYGETAETIEYPTNWRGEKIWQDSDYVVVAVIKIHFLPGTIHRGDRSTKLIKHLSKSLGTELFSLHLRESFLQLQKRLSAQRLSHYNELAHDLRNMLIKLGFISSAINVVIGFLREYWERLIHETLSQEEDKCSILRDLNKLLRERISRLDGARDLKKVGESLFMEQEELAALSLLPEKSEQWLNNKIRAKWDELLGRCNVWRDVEGEIRQRLDTLSRVIWIGTDESVAERLHNLPEDVRKLWPKLAYIDFSAEKVAVLDQILELLDRPEVTMPHKMQTKKILSSLKALVEIIPEVEARTNEILSSYKNGLELENNIVNNRTW